MGSGYTSVKLMIWKSVDLQWGSIYNKKDPPSEVIYNKKEPPSEKNTKIISIIIMYLLMLLHVTML